MGYLRGQRVLSDGNGLPVRTEGFPPMADGLPVRTEGFSPMADGLPARTEGFPPMAHTHTPFLTEL